MGKITLSFASPEKEKYLFYIYEVITWEKFHKRAANHYYDEYGNDEYSSLPVPATPAWLGRMVIRGHTRPSRDLCSYR